MREVSSTLDASRKPNTSLFGVQRLAHTTFNRRGQGSNPWTGTNLRVTKIMLQFALRVN